MQGFADARREVDTLDHQARAERQRRIDIERPERLCPLDQPGRRVADGQRAVRRRFVRQAGRHGKARVERAQRQRRGRQTQPAGATPQPGGAGVNLRPRSPGVRRRLWCCRVRRRDVQVEARVGRFTAMPAQRARPGLPLIAGGAQDIRPVETQAERRQRAAQIGVRGARAAGGDPQGRLPPVLRVRTVLAAERPTDCRRPFAAQLTGQCQRLAAAIGCQTQ